MTMFDMPGKIGTGSELGDPVEPEARLSGPARQSIRSSELPKAMPSPAADGDALDVRRRYLSILGAHADLIARTAGRDLTRDERRLLNHYAAALTELQEQS